MTEIEYKQLSQEKRWSLIAAYQKSEHIFKVDINVVEDMSAFYEWLIKK